MPCCAPPATDSGKRLKFALLVPCLLFLGACGGGGSSSGSASPSATTSTAPPVPTALLATAGDKQVSLAWTASAGATSYSVKGSSTSGGPYVLAGSVPGTNFVDLNLTDGTTYYFVVTALTGTAESAACPEVAATPSASATPLPPAEDPTRNKVGLGTWFMNDWDGSSAFVDVMKQARFWNNVGWTAAASVDAQGWPTQDASTVLFTDTPAVVNGTYKLVFTGQATVALMWSGGTISNQVYNAVSNVTTADVTFALGTTGSAGLVFSHTQRTAASAVGSGFTQARLFRPGYPVDGSVVFTAPFLAAFRASNAGVVRMMDWGGGSSDLTQHWADRSSPLSATQAGLPLPAYTAPDGTVYTGLSGVALEHRIQLCNALQTDFWINIPPLADQDCITKTAQALRFGSDGSNPYSSAQAAPVYPPLDPSLRIYVEYANETWNSTGGFDTFAIEQAICEHLPANHPLLTPAAASIWYLMWRWPAYNLANISETFRGVFGDAAMMTRVRPVLETQQGDGQDTLGQALQWLDGYAPTLATPRKVSDLLYGGGGSAYYGVINSTSAVPDVFFAPSNYPDPQTLTNFAVDSLWTCNYGIKHVAYEGGMGLGFTEADNRILNADPRMQTLTQTLHDAWSSMGGDLLTYYCLHGPSQWEFTPDITVAATPKLNALAAIMASPRAAITLGPVLPGSIVLKDASTPSLSWNADTYTTTIGGLPCLANDTAGLVAVYPGHSAAGYTGTLSLSGCASAANQVDVWVNGVHQGSVSLPVATGSTQVLVNSSAIPVTLPAGLAAIRLVFTTGSIAVRSITVQ